MPRPMVMVDDGNAESGVSVLMLQLVDRDRLRVSGSASWTVVGSGPVDRAWAKWRRQRD